jgi:hypothetical protein
VLPDIHPLLKDAGYEPYDVGVMGELDVRMTRSCLAASRWPRRWRRSGMAASTTRRSAGRYTRAEADDGVACAAVQLALEE